MSFIITVYVREGIVMASDSRLTLNTPWTPPLPLLLVEAQPTKTPQPAQPQQLTQPQPAQPQTAQPSQPVQPQQVNMIVIGFSDANDKTFLTRNNIGISTWGAADIKGAPIAGYIESFITQKCKGAPSPVEAVATGLLAHFRKFTPVPQLHFHVAGYKTSAGDPEQHVLHVDVGGNQLNRLNPPGNQGAAWGGEGDILARITYRVGTLKEDGALDKALPHFEIPWTFFTLQDAVDFCIFAVRSTIDAVRFQPRPKVVGGPIDVLVIKPDQAFWVQKKMLHGQTQPPIAYGVKPKSRKSQ